MNKQDIANTTLIITIVLCFIHPIFILLAFIGLIILFLSGINKVLDRPITNKINSPLVTGRTDYQVSSNQYMSAKEKLTYLKSDKWKQLCRLVKERDGYRCVISGSTTNLEVHHLNYYNLGNEQLSDLITLTRKCHQQQHDHYGYDRDTIYLPLIK